MKVLHVEAGKHLYGGALQVVFLLGGLQAEQGGAHILACPAGSAIAEAAQALPRGCTRSRCAAMRTWAW